MTDIVVRLRQYAENDMRVEDVCLAAADEIERLQKNDSDAAKTVESVICLRSNYFTGDLMYFGWEGLGLALRQDYDERDRLKTENDSLRKTRDELLRSLAERDYEIARLLSRIE